MEAVILAARWSSHVRSPENTAAWIMTPNPAMNRTHKQRRFACRLCSGYRKRPLGRRTRMTQRCIYAEVEVTFEMAWLCGFERPPTMTGSGATDDRIAREFS